MPFKSKNCLNCDKEIQVKSTRDMTRKQYCSHSCRMKYRYNESPWDMKVIYSKASTPEANKKKGHPGTKNPRYKTDRSTIKQKRSQFENTEWKKKVFERDNYTCQSCGKRGGKLQADHILPYSHFEELRENLSNGRTLCCDCHKSTNTYGSKLIGILREEFLIF